MSELPEWALKKATQTAEAWRQTVPRNDRGEILEMRGFPLLTNAIAAALVEARVAAASERDAKWQSGIDEICGHKFNWTNPSSGNCFENFLHQLRKERDSWIEIANARLQRAKTAEARVKELEAQVEVRQQAILTLEKERDEARQLIELLRGERDISHYSYGPDEHKKRYGGGENRFRTKCFAQPRALVKGDVLATGDAVLEAPREGYNGLVSVKMEGGFEGHTIGIAGRLPIALNAALDIEQQLDAAQAEVDRLKGLLASSTNSMNELSRFTTNLEASQHAQLTAANALLRECQAFVTGISELTMPGHTALDAARTLCPKLAAHLEGQPAQRPMTNEEKREADEFLMKSFNDQRQKESTEGIKWTAPGEPQQAAPSPVYDSQEAMLRACKLAARTAALRACVEALSPFAACVEDFERVHEDAHSELVFSVGEIRPAAAALAQAREVLK